MNGDALLMVQGVRRDMSDETKLSDALEIADSTGNAFVYKGGRLMGVVLSCDKYAEVSKGK